MNSQTSPWLVRVGRGIHDILYEHCIQNTSNIETSDTTLGIQCTSEKQPFNDKNYLKTNTGYDKSAFKMSNSKPTQ